jgi:hypothetical protein
LQPLRPLRIRAGIHGLRLGDDEAPSLETNLTCLQQDLQAGLLFVHRDADTVGNEASAMLAERFVGARLEHAQHRVRPRVLVGRTATRLEQRPALANAG